MHNNLSPTHVSLWSNEDNRVIYNNMPLEVLSSFAAKAGLSEANDIEKIKEYVLYATSFLEIGAGNGRVLKKLLELNPRAQITAVERNHAYFIQLQKEFPQVELLCQDILKMRLQKRFDGIFLMWTLISEFAENEQALLVENLATMLSDVGTLVIDCFDPNSTHPYATKTGKQNFECNTPFGIDRFYVPSHSEILNYAQNAGLMIHKFLPYMLNGTNRIIYLLRSLNSETTI